MGSNDHIDLTSSFDSNEPVGLEGVDFDNAQMIHEGSSASDVYLVELPHRKLLMKRLKREYRDKPFYRAALEKEYETGLRLEHHSIPMYRNFGGDYIVMDYIAGNTLARLIKDRDSLLRDKRNVVRMFRQLIEVVGWLHLHNVVHCDIKADNIIITESTRNVMLIDFDKCHTSWHDSTSGSPSKYGVDSAHKGSVEIDYHAVGMLTDQLREAFPRFYDRRFRRFRNECFNPEATSEKLMDILDARKRSWPGYIWIGVGVAIACGLMWTIVTKREPGAKIETKSDTYMAGTVDMVRNEVAVPQKQAMKESGSVEIQKNDTERKENRSDSGREIGDDEKMIRGELAELHLLMSNLELMLDSPERFPEEKINELGSHIDRLMGSAYKEIKNKLAAKYPEHSDSELDKLIRNSEAYREINRRRSRLLDRGGL